MKDENSNGKIDEWMKKTLHGFKYELKEISKRSHYHSNKGIGAFEMIVIMRAMEKLHHQLVIEMIEDGGQNVIDSIDDKLLEMFSEKLVKGVKTMRFYAEHEEK